MSNKTFIVKVIADNRVTIPPKVRREHDLIEGDYVELRVIRKISKTEGDEGSE